MCLILYGMVGGGKYHTFIKFKKLFMTPHGSTLMKLSLQIVMLNMKPGTPIYVKQSRFGVALGEPYVPHIFVPLHLVLRSSETYFCHNVLMV